jgi:hypothetical protein
MMAKKPSDRYQSAEEVATVIAAWRLDIDTPGWPER